MTPDAVIYRYLQTISAAKVDIELLCALLSTDADLLTRWLKLLNANANYDDLRSRLEELSKEQFQGISHAQAWSVLPIAGTARLSIEQWRSVLRGAFLAEILYLQLVPMFGASGHEDAEAKARDARLRILLAISGVQLPQDQKLSDLIDFRGARPELLEDAALELRIFAVVDAMELGTEADLAAQLLGLGHERFAELVERADQQSAALISELGIDVDSDIDWSNRIWLRQQVTVICSSFANARSWQDMLEIHSLVSRSLFSQPPLLLRYISAGDSLELVTIDALNPTTHLNVVPDAGRLPGDESATPTVAGLEQDTYNHQGQQQETLRPNDLEPARQSLRIKATSQTSLVAQAFRSGAELAVADTINLAVVDRQLLRILDCEDALAVPVRNGTVQALLLVAEDDDFDFGATARLYAEQLSKYLKLAQHNASDKSPSPRANATDGDTRNATAEMAGQSPNDAATSILDAANAAQKSNPAG